MNGVLFDNIHSYNDLNLILAPFSPAPATPKTTFVDIPGGDGTIDLSEAHGEVKFDDREFTFTFSINPTETMTFDEKTKQVSNALNGKRCKITLDRDPDYYWQGRCIVNKYACDKKKKQITVKAVVAPYKLKQDDTTVIVNLKSTAQTITLTNGRKSAVPSITCTGNTVIVFNGGTYNLAAGTHKVLDIRLTEGQHQVQVSGSGTVTFTWTEGDL